MTRFINLHAGPGVGKSTVAAKTFARLKESGANTELVSEYVKGWAWEKRTPVTTDQFYFFGHQSRREAVLVGAVDTVVTDAPSILTAYYAQVFGEPATAVVFRSMALEFRRMLTSKGVQFVDIWLRRVKPYDSRGRFQSEAEARAIDADLHSFLSSMKLDLVAVDADEGATETLLEILT